MDFRLLAFLLLFTNFITLAALIKLRLDRKSDKEKFTKYVAIMDKRIETLEKRLSHNKTYELAIK